MKINVQVIELNRSTRGTSVRLQNEHPVGRDGGLNGQVISFALAWSDPHFPIELGNRYTLTLTPGASEASDLRGLGDD